MNRKFLIHLSTPLFALFLTGCVPSFLIPSAWLLVPPLAALSAALLLILFCKPKNLSRISDNSSDRRFTGENITHTFIAALPILTREMKLEVASSKQTEVLERSNSKKGLGVGLGTNHARITVPVTYRYCVGFHDTWVLHVDGTILIVYAPEMKCSLPPAIHTDEARETCARGWARGSPAGLLEELRRDLTSILSQYANDGRRLDLVRDVCRQSVAEFIRRWLESEGRWGPGRFTAIYVRFAGEETIPSHPALQLNFQQNNT